MAVNVVLVQNLGNEFDLGNIETGKIHLLTDGSIVRNPTTGELSVDVGVLGITNTLSLAGTSLTSNVNGTVANQDLLAAIQAGETVTSLSVDNVAHTITYTREDGTTDVIDLAAATTEIYVDGGSFDATTGVLTLTDNDGASPDVVIDLSGYAVTVVDNADGTYDVNQNGASVGTIDLAPSTDAGNLITQGTDGRVFIDASAIGTDTFVDNGDGTVTHNALDGTAVTFDAKLGVSADAGNLLVDGTDVLPFVDAGTIRALADIEIQDAFGSTLYYAYSTNV